MAHYQSSTRLIRQSDNWKSLTTVEQGAAPDRLQLRSLVPRSLRFRRRVSLVVLSLRAVWSRIIRFERGDENMNTHIRATVLVLLLLLNLGFKSQAKTLSRQQAVRAAEKFIIENGYTNLPPMSDTSKLTLESIEWTSDRKRILKQRHNSLERKAYGFLGNSKGKPGWTIAFRYKNSRNKDAGRAVTMDVDGKNKRMQHVDIFLSKCKKL